MSEVTIGKIQLDPNAIVEVELIRGKRVHLTFSVHDHTHSAELTKDLAIELAGYLTAAAAKIP